MGSHKGRGALDEDGEKMAWEISVATSVANEAEYWHRDEGQAWNTEDNGE